MVLSGVSAANGKRLDDIIMLNQNCAVRAHGQCCTQSFLSLLWANRNHDDFFNLTSFFHTNRLFDRNFIEWIH